MFKNTSIETLEINNKRYDFISLNELPSYFIPYNTKRVYVRGLRIIETRALSRLLKNLNENGVSIRLQDLLNIYHNVIQGISFEELCEIDFLALCTISTLHTQEGHHWTPNITCPHCGIKNGYAIHFGDLEFSEPKSKTFTKEFLTSDGINLELKLPSVQKIADWDSQKESYENNEDIFKDAELFKLTPLVYKYDSKPISTLSEAYTILCDLIDSDLKKVLDADDEFNINIIPINLKCINKECEKDFKLEFGLNYYRVYP